jgi:hypothetical protein
MDAGQIADPLIKAEDAAELRRGRRADDIGERLIRAAEIIDRLDHVGPRHLRGQALPYVHSVEDMRNWGRKLGERRSKAPDADADACRLHPEDEDAHSLYRREFWESIDASARAMTEAEEAIGWLALVEKDENRAALAAWAGCMASAKRRFFKDWCATQRISEQTGRRRKERAIVDILARISRSGVQNDATTVQRVLLDAPEIDHLGDTLREPLDGWVRVPRWKDDPSTRPIFDGNDDFSWADSRNEKRKNRRKQKQRQTAKA